MANVTLLHYNNYFNRTIKKLDTVAAYQTADPQNNKITGVNFVPGDGVVTSLILGTYSLGMGYDYVVVSEVVNSTETIKSRWFLMEENRTRDGQYSILLKRDVVADFYSEVSTAPCFIEKGTVADISNPLLYNSEDYKVNQIKTSETLIKDRSGVAWIVGYVSSKLSTETKDVEVTTVALNESGQASGSTVYSVSYGYVKIYIEYNGARIYSGETGFTASLNSSTGVLTYNINYAAWAEQTVSIRVLYTQIGSISSGSYKTTIPGDETRKHLIDAPYDMFCIPYGEVLLNSANITTVKQAALEIAFEFAKDLGRDSIYDIQLLPYCPRQDMILTGKVAETLGTSGYDYNYIYDSSNNVKSIMLWCTKSNDSFVAEADSPIVISRELGDATSKTASGSDATLIKLSNASIRIENDIFKTVKVTGITSLVASKDSTTDTISSFISFSQNESTGVVVISYTGTSFATGNHNGVSYTLSFSCKPFVNPEYLDYKISNECDVFRLVSPNYSGQFEWSLAKSSGSSGTFDVDFSYKPFQPYIHLAPVFTYLYGQDFNDARGLICGGDFSLPIITDAWTEYQVHNKTYQDVFDRQIQNMDTMNVIQGSQAAIQGALGIPTAMTGGALAGLKMGGPMGAAAGAVVGGATSAMGMVADMELLKQTQAENRSYAYDMFNYGLQNIQALPYGLTKVAAYTQNNKIFPMVEYYTCSDIEKDAFKNKLQYNGMSVNIISTIGNFVSQNEVRFIKGQIIRLPSLNEDAHIANEIYNEISKGVYI